MTLARTTDDRGVCWRLCDTDWGVVLDKRTPNSKRWRWVMVVASKNRDLGRDRDAVERKLNEPWAFDPIFEALDGMVP